MKERTGGRKDPVYALMVWDRGAEGGPWSILAAAGNLRIVTDSRNRLRRSDPGLAALIGSFPSVEAAHRDIARLNEKENRRKGK